MTLYLYSLMDVTSDGAEGLILRRGQVCYSDDAVASC